MADYTHCKTAENNYQETLHRTGHPNNPAHPDKQQHSEDVLYTGEVDAK